MEVVVGFGVFLAALAVLTVMIAFRRVLFAIGWVMALLATAALLGSLVMGDLDTARIAALYACGGIGLMLPMLMDDIP